MSVARGASTMHTTIAMISILVGLATGCGNDGDSPALGGDVVGTWRLLPNATDDDPVPPIADRDVIEFAADGTYITTDFGEMSTGRYEVDDGELVVTEDGETESIRLPYLATDDRFVLGVLLPQGEVDGFVGTWTGTVTDTEGSTTVTFELASDFTAHLAYDFATEPDMAFDGTWRSIGDDLAISFMPEENFTVNTHATRVAGVLGTAFERVP